MTNEDSRKPWEELEDLVESMDSEKVAAFLLALPARETVHTVARLSELEQEHLLSLLDPETAADLIEQLPDAAAAEMLERLTPTNAAAIVHELASDDQVDVLAEIDDTEAEAILAALDPDEAGELRALRRYNEHVAGGLMKTEHLAFPATATVQEVIDDLRANTEKYADYEVQYGYVFDTDRKLVGVLRMRDLLLARGTERVDGIMIEKPIVVRDEASLDEMRELFDTQSFLGVPAVDQDGRMLGVVLRSAVDHALTDRLGSDYQKAAGILGGEELRSFPVLLRSRRRLAWLSVNIVLNIIAASIIVAYEDTLAAVISLAVFLPIISDMSGCSGNQAIAVSMRELSLGLVSQADLTRVWLKEISVGVINGLTLGLLIGVVAWGWKGNLYFGVVLGAALAINTMVAVSLGGTVPLLLRKLKMDPALASGPILTTVTDMCGFFLVLSFASAMLGRLVE